MDVIIWSQENGTLAVCIPTGELPIEQVLAKDAPINARIVSLSDLPIALDDPEFGALRLAEDGSIYIDQAEAARLMTPPTTAEKLSKAGVTLDELKVALGIEK